VRIVENKRDRRDEPAVFYAVFAFIAPRASFAIAKGILRKFAAKSLKKRQKYQIVEKSDESKTALQECLKGKKKPPASALQGALFCVVIFFRRGVAAQGVC
jgi:hypothetical protein